MATDIDSIKTAINHRDTSWLLSCFFSGTPPILQQGFRYESENWDFKGNCPGHGIQNERLWAGIGADVLAFHNAGGGILFFGIDDETYSYCGTSTPIDAKQFNDKIRKYTGDKFWVTYVKAFSDASGRYLGVALVQKRGLQVVPFYADAPSQKDGSYFLAGDIAIRIGDETKILRGEKASEYLATLHIPNSDGDHLVNEPSFRILRPDWEQFVMRDSECKAVLEGLEDDRTFVTSLTGIGGVGKTSLACWGVLQAYEKRWFDYIISITAKDRELTSSGIKGVSPTGTTLEHLLDCIAETIGFSELVELEMKEKQRQIVDLLRGTRTLLFVDNLETINDTALISFLENLPLPVKAILTSRKTRVRKAVFPVEIGELDVKEALSFLELIAAKKGRDFVPDMRLEERKLIVENCFRIPLVIEWLVGSTKDGASLIAGARNLELAPREAEEVLEFSFRRIHSELSANSKKVLVALALFPDAQSLEPLHAACSIPIVSVSDAIDELLDCSLVIPVFDRRLNDTTYGILPITKRFAQSELERTPELDKTLRRALTIWYEGSDIADKGERELTVAIRRADKDPDTLLVNAAIQLRKQGKIQDSEKFLMQAIQRNPTGWKANRELGDLYKEEKKTTLAIERYKKAAALSPKKGKDRALIFREYGILLKDSGTPTGLKEAAEALEQAIRETPNDHICVYVLAQILCRRGMHKKALPLLEQLAATDNTFSHEKAFPLLKECYEQERDMLKLSLLKERAAASGISLHKQ